MPRRQKSQVLTYILHPAVSKWWQARQVLQVRHRAVCHLLQAIRAAPCTTRHSTEESGLMKQHAVVLAANPITKERQALSSKVAIHS